MENEELLRVLADDTWEIAKNTVNYYQKNNLKSISGCLHDLAAGRDTKWYLETRMQENEQKSTSNKQS